MSDDITSLLRAIWSALEEDPSALAAVRFTGPSHLLPSVYAVSDLASATVAAASLAVARYASTADAAGPAVIIDGRAASAAFLSEALFRPDGWALPPIWDAIAGDYDCADGWIRLHTNYVHHRAAVEAVLGAHDNRSSVAAAVRRWTGSDLEEAVVAAGGAAAMMRTRAEWLASPAGESVADQPLIQIERGAGRATEVGRAPDDPARPLAGVRVLDLTRVVAGPVATRFLAGYGADVLRIDPPGFAEVPSLLPFTTAGKRCAALDLRAADGRARFESLVAAVDVLVCGYRSDALDQLGYSAPRLRAINPSLIDARLDAYGWSGPWAQRRGFDSLVQMSCGIAAAGAAALAQSTPRALPAQALDHGTGYLLAAAIVAALRRRRVGGEVTAIRCALTATAALLMDHPRPGGLVDGPSPFGPADTIAADTVAVDTDWGSARAVPIPGGITGIPVGTLRSAGPLGRDEPNW